MTTLKTNMQEQIPPKTDGFWFEVERTMGNHSHDDLDETDDKDDDQIRSPSPKTPSSSRSEGVGSYPLIGQPLCIS